PEPVPALDGALVTTVAVSGIAEPRHCALFCWLPGDPPAPGIPFKVMERIGACTASLHLHAEQFVPPAGFVRPSWDWQRLFGPSSIMAPEKSAVLLAPDQRALLVAVSARVRDELHVLETTPAHWGLIHADLHRDNILIADGQVGVIDFDDCGWGHYLFDVASVLDSFRRRVVADPRDYPALREAYLAGYHQVRLLPDRLDAQLTTFLVLRDMTNVNFILGSRNASVQEWGGERIVQIMQHMKEYLG
ncbi:MAG: phosphotransferase, partial [Chloroflexota bacterium]|nr:phosphotransferase [Chloroflexota bacterium]